MKKLFSLILAVFMLLGLAACGGNGSMQTNPADSGLQVGFGRENITPSTSVCLQGGSYENRRSEGVLDYLYATCIAIRDGDVTVLLYTVDIKLMTGSFVAPMKTLISTKTGVPEERIFLSATHTHSGPAVRYSWGGSAQYLTEFNNYMVSAATRAIEDLAPATAFSGSTQTQGLAFVRHYLLADGTVGGPNFGSGSARTAHVREADGELVLVRFERADKKDILLMSFGAHCTMNGQETDLMLSADYPSPAREYIESADPDLLAAFFQGASGDQVPSSSVEESFSEQYRKHGETLGKYAMDALKTLEPVEGTAIHYVNQPMTYATNKKDLDKTSGFNGRFEEKWIGIRKSLPATKQMVLRAITVGDLGFVIAPYEMFGENGKFIKEQSPCKSTMIITCGEGNNSYLAAKSGFSYNSYEAQVCYYAEGVAEQVAQDYVDILVQLKGQ